MKISIPEWLKREKPINAGFCELINETLLNSPNMSLAEFAEQLHKVNVEATYRRIQEAERQQFEEIITWRNRK